jgi:hypothetical protein
MGYEVELDPCLRHSGKALDGRFEAFIENCKTKTVYLAAGGVGIGGPKFRPAVLTGPPEIVDPILKLLGLPLEAP